VIIIIILATSGLIETDGKAEWDSETNETDDSIAAIGVWAPKRKGVGVDRNGNVRPKW
jgi:hypothetical protein